MFSFRFFVKREITDGQSIKSIKVSKQTKESKKKKNTRKRIINQRPFSVGENTTESCSNKQNKRENESKKKKNANGEKGSRKVEERKTESKESGLIIN